MSPQELLLYRYSLLGSDRRVTNFGEGNTSEKLEAVDPLTREPSTPMYAFIATSKRCYDTTLDVIDRAIARRLFDEGACADVVDGVWFDVTEDEAVDRLLIETAWQFGGVDICVSNAGIASAAPIERTSPHVLDQSHNVTDPIESLPTSAIELKRAYAQALVDRKALAGYQETNNALMSAQTLKRALTTHPILVRARERKGTAIDPIGAYRRNGYRAECARRRPATGSSRSGIV